MPCNVQNSPTQWRKKWLPNAPPDIHVSKSLIIKSSLFPACKHTHNFFSQTFNVCWISQECDNQISGAYTWFSSEIYQENYITARGVRVTSITHLFWSAFTAVRSHLFYESGTLLCIQVQWYPRVLATHINYFFCFFLYYGLALY